MFDNSKKISEIKLEEFKTSYESLIYNSKPNFKYKENIVNDFKHDYWIFDNYDIYYTNSKCENNKFDVFLVYGCDDNNNINIVRLFNKKLIKSLKGHEGIVDIVKHFYNKKDKIHYLLSADYNKIIIVWNLNNYLKLLTINTEYSDYINSFLIFFNKNYILTSSNGSTDCLKIYSLLNGKLIKTIKISSKNESLYLLMWKYLNKYFLIELSNKKIFIYDLSSGVLFKILVDTGEDNFSSSYYSGFVSHDNKYLYTCSSTGQLNIWNLYKDYLIFKITIKDSYLFKISLWSTEIKNYILNQNEKEKEYQKIDNYILITDKRRNGFYCINFSFLRSQVKKFNKELDSNFDYKIYSFYSNKNTIKCIKK